ncbi:MAG: hypothetical protein ABIG96_01965 [Candidatus Micrarchaeota archaeon]
MEFFLIRKHEYSKLISEEDEFYYPIIFQTSLLNSRYIGKKTLLKLRGIAETFEGTLLGVSQEPLIDVFKKYFSNSPDRLSSSSLPIEENEFEWLDLHLKSKKPHAGVKFTSNPGKPPYYFLLSEKVDFLVFSSFSEEELEDLPQINYNKIILNESIEKLLSYLKQQLPKKPHEKKHREPSLETKLKQLRIAKFLKSAEEEAEKN